MLTSKPASFVVVGGILEAPSGSTVERLKKIDKVTFALIVYLIRGSIVTLVVPSCGVPSSVYARISYLIAALLVLQYARLNF